VSSNEYESSASIATIIRTFSLSFLKQEHFSVVPAEVKTVSGRGVIGIVNDEKWYIGKQYLAKQTEFQTEFYGNAAESLAKEGKTVVYVRHLGKIVAIYALQDTVRTEAKRAIRYLNERGIYTIMLTGDNELT